LPEYWWVDNDAWSSGHGPQTIYVCSPSSWYATSDQPNVGGQVETYPNTTSVGVLPQQPVRRQTPPSLPTPGGPSHPRSPRSTLQLADGMRLMTYG
jgi:hypothetical protein